MPMTDSSIDRGFLLSCPGVIVTCDVDQTSVAGLMRLRRAQAWSLGHWPPLREWVPVEGGQRLPRRHEAGVVPTGVFLRTWDSCRPRTPVSDARPLSRLPGPTARAVSPRESWPSDSHGGCAAVALGHEPASAPPRAWWATPGVDDVYTPRAIGRARSVRLRSRPRHGDRGR